MYKLEKSSLFRLTKNALGGEYWVHVAVAPVNCKTLERALEWYFQ